MNIQESYIRRVDIKGLEKIELIGKVCTKLESTIKPGTASIFCKNRLIDGHTAIFEHEYVYFNIENLSDIEKQDLIILNSYIRFSNDLNYCGFCYRVFIDILEDTFRNKVRHKLLNNIEIISDIIYSMLYKCNEFAILLMEKQTILNKLNLRENCNYLNFINRVDETEIFHNAPEILNITYKITTDRGITHECVRHKEMSFMQESTRYVNYSKDKYSKQINVIDSTLLDDKQNEEWADAMVDAESHYMNLIELKTTPQLARSVLNNSTKADIYVSGTADMWFGELIELQLENITIKENKGFLPLRNNKSAHPQMIPIAKNIQDDLLNYFVFNNSDYINLKRKQLCQK